MAVPGVWEIVVVVAIIAVAFGMIAFHHTKRRD